MIRSLKGTVESYNTTHVLIDVHGVGYVVYPSASVLEQISGTGCEIKVYTYMHVREDILELYGFSSLDDLYLFQQCISVSGIGPKTAMGIFAIGNRDTIAHAILTEDVTFFSSVPRLGKKNAQKLIIELKSKIGSLESLGTTSLVSSNDSEVMVALKAFGFSTAEIHEALKHLDPALETSNEKIKGAFKYLGK